MPLPDVYTQPLRIQSVRGAVIVSHPEGSGASALSPDAAMASARRLIEAAALAASDSLPPVDFSE